MAFAIVRSRAQRGLQSPSVTVEVHVSGGLPRFLTVGLPETAVKESKERVRSALINSGFTFPSGRITVNLAPADLPKDGARFDLPIAVGILAATAQIPPSVTDAYEFLGELGLSGELRAVRGIVASLLSLRSGDRSLIAPTANAAAAGLVSGTITYCAQHLLEVTAHLNDCRALPRAQGGPTPPSSAPNIDLSDIRGQDTAKRALLVAAAGGHNMVLVGPPGTGKTMLAKRLPGLLPELTEHEALECAALQSLRSEGLDTVHWRVRPFRAPHHTCSSVALVGGGNKLQPGEVSLAHNGVLFLDELPEFARHVLEVLREPLESGQVTISRAIGQTDFPAKFQLITAMNPCPCGWLGGPPGKCECNEEQIRRYRARISGPLLDRIDLHVSVPAVDLACLGEPDKPGRSETADFRARVADARKRQSCRGTQSNCSLSAKQIAIHCRLKQDDRLFLQRVGQQLSLSARAWHRILKVSRTIADLAGEPNIGRTHLAEAIGFRILDRPVR